MQILVEVEITKMRLSLGRVNKGFARTAFVCELVGPKEVSNVFLKKDIYCPRSPKGNRIYISELHRGLLFLWKLSWRLAATQMNSSTSKTVRG